MIKDDIVMRFDIMDMALVSKTSKIEVELNRNYPKFVREP